jgi:hypothetical protein
MSVNSSPKRSIFGDAAVVEIISKSNGPRREDAAAKHFIRENAGTINKIAQQLSGARMRPLSNAETIPVPLPPKRGPATPSRTAEKKPYVKVSLNGRVIAVDFNTGRQLHHLGEIRGRGPGRRFLLATRENRFFTPLDGDLLALLRDLDCAATLDEAAEESLAKEIGARLGYSA